MYSVSFSTIYIPRRDVRLVGLSGKSQPASWIREHTKGAFPDRVTKLPFNYTHSSCTDKWPQLPLCLKLDSGVGGGGGDARISSLHCVALTAAKDAPLAALVAVLYACSKRILLKVDLRPYFRYYPLHARNGALPLLYISSVLHV